MSIPGKRSLVDFKRRFMSRAALAKLNWVNQVKQTVWNVKVEMEFIHEYRWYLNQFFGCYQLYNSLVDV